MNERRTYGDAVAHSHRLDGSPALITRSLPRSQIGITRISCGPEHIGMKAKIPAEDTFIAALHLTAVEHHELWSDGRPVISQGYAANSLRIVNLGAEFSSYVASPHEALSYYIPRTVLNGFTDDAGGPSVADLYCRPGIIDPVVAHLGAALLPVLEHPNEACSLFVDQVALALMAHLSRRYGGFIQRETIRARGLSLPQAQRAKEYLASNLSGDVLIADVAKACGLSRGHFTRAFRETTGMTPHKWLQLRRIQQAKALLLESSISAAEIAVISGFADQSHLTRVFTRLVGSPPAGWRREHKGQRTIGCVTPNGKQGWLDEAP
jgi:AraC family transcriptional regulator